VDRATVDVYEASADLWLARRQPRFRDRTAAFATRVGPTGPTADLGCGPGFYTDLLPAPTVALDAACSMLALLPARAPAALRVQGDLEALPFRRGALAGAWARNSYVHLPRALVPAALAQLHLSLRLDAPVELTFFGGAGEGRGLFADDDVPGRYFSLWAETQLADVVVGAGFEVDELATETNSRGEQSFTVRARRGRRLPDFVGPGLRLLLCGLNPSVYSADAGVGFARPGNRFWPAALAAGIVTRDRDVWRTLRADRVGMTDLVKRATVSAAELSATEYAEGLARVDRLAAWLEPGAVCFLGLSGWRAVIDRQATAGPQVHRVGGRPTYLMPNPSGLNAHARVADLADHLRAAAALADLAAG
jgi:TDG/mug DNA glycosylase family protein